MISRRALLARASVSVAVGTGSLSSYDSASANCHTQEGDNEILGQGQFRYRANRLWGRLDHQKYPVQDCHGISGDRSGRIVALTNDIHNNLIAYSKTGEFISAWETRFYGAHGFDIVNHQGEDQYWITDQLRQLVYVCTPGGKELMQITPDNLRSKYPDMSKYHPTNTATLPDGDFFIADGYGSGFIHHFDPKGQYISSFGGEGSAPENLYIPHAVWVDQRSAKPQLLVCDREHNMLKWFTTRGELLRIVELGAIERYGESVSAAPCNVAQFGGRLKDHLAIACLRGMILILDGSDRIVSAVGGMPPLYLDGKLQSLEVFNYTFNHPHDIYVDPDGALYVAQWSSNQTYPIKLEPEHLTT